MLERLTRIDQLVVLRLFLGALFCTVFFENLAFKRYTADGYERLIERYGDQTSAPGFWSDGVMQFFADNSEVLSKVQAVTELSFGVLLVAGIAAGAVALAAAGFLFSLWLSELGIFWIWELLGLVAVAVAVALGNLPTLLRGSVTERLLGWRTWGASLGLPSRLAGAVILALLLWVAVDSAGTGGGDNEKVAWRAALVFGAALAVGAWLDGRRAPRPRSSEELLPRERLPEEVVE